MNLAAIAVSALDQPLGVEVGKLNQVADGVWVGQSEWVWTNSIAVRGVTVNAWEIARILEPHVARERLTRLRTRDYARLDRTAHANAHPRTIGSDP